MLTRRDFLRTTSAAGAEADVTVLEMREDSFEFIDNAETKRTGTRRLAATTTIVGGRRA